ncbi:MAG: O-antigen translocase [Pedobacter sp.]|uniref:O-antigen translocase n=1 Tax=Pedobacter sp. TaxID=1411316 RepID=UPI0028089913|nr:O-antigen translocase [Pedobacter sp.]MDQ8004331.1 O-antigen translocase [Pedobacter sp.]
MSEEKSYRDIFKATSLFGGVQVIVIIFSIIRSKAIALWLGPDGIGVMGVFISAITFVFSICSFGIGSSSVRNISQEKANNNLNAIKGTISVVRTLSFGSGILGLLITVFFSGILSKVSFESNYENYTIAFALLSLSVFFMAWESGENAILQGLRELKWLAKSSVISSFCGTVLVLPLYYFYGLKAIVPSLLITYLFSALIPFLYTNKIKLPTSNFLKERKVEVAVDILKFGLAMAMSSIMVYAVMFVIRVYISNKGSMADVGYYQAAFAILNGYVGLLFTAMSKDYYPRLCELNEDTNAAGKIANYQIEMGLLILGPIVAFLIIGAPIIIRILYSNEFLSITSIMYWSLIGIFFKVLSWSFSYVILSKGDKKYFVLYEVVGNLTILVTHILGYEKWGLNGLGYAFLLSNIVYFIMVYVIVKRKYAIFLGKGALVTFIYTTAICLLLIFLVMQEINLIFPIGMSLFLLFLSLRKLDKKMKLGLLNFFKA